MPLEHAEVVVSVLRMIIIAADPLTTGAAQSLLASSSRSVHNPLVDQTLSDKIVPLGKMLVLEALLLLRNTAALLVLVLLDLRSALLSVVPVRDVFLLLRAAAATAPKVDPLRTCLCDNDQRGNKRRP